MALMPGHQEMVLEVSFIHTCADTYVNAAACTDGASAQRRDDKKRQHNRIALPATPTPHMRPSPVRCFFLAAAAPLLISSASLAFEMSV